MEFSSRILNWYQIKKRELPWRNTKEPYIIWVSEIILQQTRVKQGLDYFTRFIHRFPDVKTLAEADENDVLSVWKGLGYYSRARNMHLTAKVVSEKFNCKFPSDFKTLLTLKGIGAYTAAAISSICGNEPIPVVDGNVMRVLSRIYGFNEPVGSGKFNKLVTEKASDLISKNNPGDFNQALMEFGAIWCKPAKPLCNSCIFGHQCYAFQNDLIGQLPVPKKEIRRRNRYFNYMCISIPGRGILMKKRTKNDIWRNLWDLPLYETDRLVPPEEIKKSSGLRSIMGTVNIDVSRTMDFKHILTHQVIFARFFLIDTPLVSKELIDNREWLVVDPLVTELPVSRLTEKFLQQSGISFQKV